MNIEILNYYLHRFTHLRRDQKKGGAPHKPVLLLSVLQGVADGWISNRYVEVSPELVGTFKDYWHRLVETDHTCNFPLPYFHMRSEKFWRLIPKAGFERFVPKARQLRSFIDLKETIVCAELDQELFDLMSGRESGRILQEILLDTYFPETKANLSKQGLLYDLTEEMLSEPAEIYSEKLQALKEKLEQYEYEEELFIRSGVFRRTVIGSYDNTCAISGLKINARVDVSMIDACHIVPFSRSNDDTISNGLALCPNLHRAFDRGLIGIDEQYRILVSDHFKEVNSSAYSLLQFEGKPVSLPEKEKLRPRLEHFHWHRENIFLG